MNRSERRRHQQRQVRREERRRAALVFALIPNEILRHIILQLTNANDFDSVRLVCKRFAAQTPSLRDQFEKMNVFRWTPFSVWRASMKRAALKYGFKEHVCCEYHFSKVVTGKRLELFVDKNDNRMLIQATKMNIVWNIALNDVVAPNWDLLLANGVEFSNATEFSKYVVFKDGRPRKFHAGINTWYLV